MKNNRVITITAVICCIAIIAMIISLALSGNENEKSYFIPPAFDKNAVAGTPSVDDDSWMPIYKDGMNFSAHVCGRVIVKNNMADIYFTNDKENDVWMKLRITDDVGNIIGETGLIKAGEYVKSIAFNKVPGLGTKIKMKIMAYEPETYHSAGSVSLNTSIGG